MKAVPYILREAAILDLQDIWLYTLQKWSKEQADRYHKLIYDEIKYLCKNVNAGRSLEHLRPGYRAAIVKHHLIIYRVSSVGIEVVRILHERMDIKSRLDDL